MLKEFRDFILRGNVLDLAVAVIIGGAFGKIVDSLVTDILMPPLGLLLGRVDFSNLFIDLSGEGYPSLAAAQQAGAPTLNYGLFINNVINFLIIAAAIFFVIRLFNRLRAAPTPGAEAEPTTKECPHCYSVISIKATRCPFCTSELNH
ncbi:MAG: Large-conductance mechanosensitive channel [Anaerolineae bacterium]|jgi:large conductance mechanosensitive channel|nr:MAG: Large-conductance mechanosensitive channel [Anaerolineae bacterium]